MVQKVPGWEHGGAAAAFFLISIALLGVVACSSSRGNGDPTGDVGSASVALAVVPTDVSCLLVQVEGSRSVTRSFDVSPGAPAELMLQGLPLGSVRFSGTAFPVGCSSIAAAVPSWASDQTEALLRAGEVAHVKLTLRRPGRATINVDFVDEPDGGPPDASAGPCEPGFHLVSDGRCRPILLADDFEDGVIADHWQRYRKVFTERNGRMNAEDAPRPGFDYGHGGNGRSAVLLTHVGDPSWRDYRVDLDMEVIDPVCGGIVGFHFRTQQLPESWNDPATTSYIVEVIIGECGSRDQSLHLSSTHGTYFTNPGCCTLAAGSSRGLFPARVSVPANRPHHYSIEVVGQTIKFWIDGTAVIDYVDNVVPFAPGAAPITDGGLAIYWGYDAPGWVDNVIVTDLR